AYRRTCCDAAFASWGHAAALALGSNVPKPAVSNRSKLSLLFSDSAPRPFPSWDFEDDVDPLYVAFAQHPAEIGIVPTLRAARTADLGYDPSREFWLRPSAKLLCH